VVKLPINATTSLKIVFMPFLIFSLGRTFSFAKIWEDPLFLSLYGNCFD
jgi:hypothetical protein